MQEPVGLSAFLRDTAREHPREAVRALADAVSEACGGHVGDDAVVLCLDWHGPRPEGAS